MKLTKTSIFLLAIILLIGCRGDRGTKPPVHPITNMDSQDKFKAYGMNTFFADSIAMRQPVEGTIARNSNFGNTELLTGMDSDSNFVSNPLALTDELVARGRERFDIFCAICHGPQGDGTGNITKYKYPIPPTNFHQDWLIEKADGYYYNVISNGIRTMPSYKHQIPVKDRWAIVGYVRKLQEDAK